MGASHGRHQLRLSLSRAPPAGRPVPTRPRTRPCRGRSAAHRSRRCRRRCTRVPVRCACRGPGREHEAAVELHGRGGRRVRDDRRMRPDRRAGDGRADGQRRRLRERTDHAPHEGALTLLVVPRMKVVGDPQRVEAGRLRTLGLVDKFLRTELLAGQEISDLGHGRGLPATGGLKHREGPRTESTKRTRIFAAKWVACATTVTARGGPRLVPAPERQLRRTTPTRGVVAARRAQRRSLPRRRWATMNRFAI
jgi:hypothetical protein